MFIGKQNELSRRAFMRRSSQVAAMGAASSYALGLAGIGEAAAFSNAGGYKALVCIFLYGGNDHGNTLIPYDLPNYTRYSEIRGGNGSQAGGGIALPRASLANSVLQTPQGQTLTDDITYAIAPSMPNLKARFDEGVMAPLLNVGPLMTPTSLAQYEARSVPLPPKLFSHNDQQSTWQSSQPEGAPTGWGGRMSDLALSSNTNAMFTGINLSGNAVFLSGQTAVPYQMAASGATEFRALRRDRLFGSRENGAVLDSILRSSSGNVFAADHALINDRSIQYGQFINQAIDDSMFNTPFNSSNQLARQLQAVASLIAGRDQLGVTRQVFMVSLGGFDHHDQLIGSHEERLGYVDDAMNSFYQATVELGVANQVTTFTASDFGRTFASNGDGSDHGWGGHHFIMGGAVNGGRFYGTAPSVSLETPDQVGRGRLLPSTSVDEYSATLARWFGVSNSELVDVSPNIGRFASSDLGFMG